jgi:hypothetical protein
MGAVPYILGNSFLDANFAAVAPGWISVFTYGAKGDGVTDDTAAIQQAYAAAVAYATLYGGATLFFPDGTYLISDEIVISAQNITVRGAGFRTVILKQSNTAKNVLKNTASNNAFFDLSVTYSTQGAAGTSGFLSKGVGGAAGAQVFNTIVNNIAISNAYDALQSNWENSAFYNNVFIGTTGNNITRYGVYFNQSQNISVDQYIILNVDPSGTASGSAICLNGGYVSGCVVGNGEFYNNNRPLLVTGSALGPGSAPTYAGSPSHCFFTNSFFDSGRIDAYIAYGQDLTFSACWFSNGRTGGGYPGLTLGTVQGVTFTDTQFVNSGAEGCYVNSTALNVVFAGCSFLNNSVTSGSSVKSGLYIAAGTQYFTVSNCTAGMNSYVAGYGYQKYGVEIAGTTCDYFNVSGNNFYSNLAGGLSNGSTQTHWTVSDSKTGLIQTSGSGATLGATGFALAPASKAAFWQNGTYVNLNLSQYASLSYNGNTSAPVMTANIDTVGGGSSTQMWSLSGSGSAYTFTLGSGVNLSASGTIQSSAIWSGSGTANTVGTQYAYLWSQSGPYGGVQLGANTSVYGNPSGDLYLNSNTGGAACLKFESGAATFRSALTVYSGNIQSSGSVTATSFVVSPGISYTYSGGYGSINFASNTSIYGNGSQMAGAVGGSTAYIYTTSSFTLGSGISAANAFGFTAWTNVSDERLKKNIEPYTVGFKDVADLKPVYYQYNGQGGTVDDGRTFVGFIAQDIEKTSFSGMVKNHEYDGEAYKTVNTSELIFALVNTVKELEARIKVLEEKTGA